MDDIITKTSDGGSTIGKLDGLDLFLAMTPPGHGIFIYMYRHQAGGDNLAGGRDP